MTNSIEKMVDAVINKKCVFFQNTKISHRVFGDVIEVFYHGENIFTKDRDGDVYISFCGFLNKAVLNRLNALAHTTGYTIKFTLKGEKLIAEDHGHKIEIHPMGSYDLKSLNYNLSLANPPLTLW